MSNKSEAKLLVAHCSLLMLFSTLFVTAGGCASHQTAQAKQTYCFWPAAPDEPRVQFLVAFNSSQDLQPKQSAMDEMLYGKVSVLPFAKPYGVAMWEGKIYLCDVRSVGVTVLDLRKHQTRVVGLGEGNSIGKANDIAIAPDGFKYVVDTTHAAIAVLDPSDHLQGLLAPRNLAPVSVAVYGDELFVADFAEKLIKVLDRHSGQVLRTIGGKGLEDGQFWELLTVRVDPEGNVVATDFFKSQVEKFTRDGQFLTAFAQMGNRPGDLNKPKHFAFDKNGYMYIADAAFNNVQVFDREGKIVDYFGAPGDHPGAMNMPTGVFVDEDPADVELFRKFIHPAFDAQRLVLVTNQFGNQRIAIYAQGQLREGKTLADIMGVRTEANSGTTQPTTEPTTQPAQVATSS